jgi:hypothetical protein
VKLGAGGSFEVTLGSTGALQGTARKRKLSSNKFATDADAQQTIMQNSHAEPLLEVHRSRLSKAALLKRFLRVWTFLRSACIPEECYWSKPYAHWKRSADEYQQRKTQFTASAPFNSWLGQEAALDDFLCENPGCKCLCRAQQGELLEREGKEELYSKRHKTNDELSA